MQSKSSFASADKRLSMTTLEPNAYLKTKVLTAGPAELRLLLIDGAIKFVEQGKSGLEKKNYEEVYNGISQCQQILMELTSSLNREIEPELCDRLSGLYTFMYGRLIEASTEKDVSKMDEVLELLRFERETWQMLRDKMARENTGAAHLSNTPPPTNDSEAELKPTGTDALIGGTISLEG